MEFVSSLERFRNTLVLVSDDPAVESLCKDSDAYSVIHVANAHALLQSDKSRTVYPVCAGSIELFEQKCEDFLTMLRGQDISLHTADSAVISEKNLIFSSSQKEFLNEKEFEIREIFEMCRNIEKDRSAHLHRHLELAEGYLSRTISAPEFFFSSEREIIADLIFNERVKELLSAQVELAYFANSEIDPVDGWLEYLTKENSFEARNPFISVSMDSSTHGAIRRIEYFPRKLLLNDGFSSLYWSPSDSSSSFSSTFSVASEKYRIMRKQPDLFAIRFDEPIALEEGNIHPHCSKVLYLKSGLGSFMPNSTTGFTLDYWLEQADQLEDKGEFAWLHFPLLFPGTAEMIHLRALTSLGGEDQTLYNLKNEKVYLQTSQVPGSLFGIRLINSATHFIIDIRFAKEIEEISFSKDGNPRENTLIKLAFKHSLTMFKGYERIQSMYFCVY
jgi:hypothetical protein